MKRSRMSLSIPGALYDRLHLFARSVEIPMARITAQALEAVLAGRIELSTKRPQRESEESAERHLALRTKRARRAAASIRLQPTCAVCTGDAITDTSNPQCATLQPLGPNDALVTVCHACNTVPAGDPRYVISESVRPGMADGANWARNRRVG